MNRCQSDLDGRAGQDTLAFEAQFPFVAFHRVASELPLLEILLPSALRDRFLELREHLAGCLGVG